MTKQFYWNVFYCNPNSGFVEPYNIFDHVGWRRDVVELCSGNLRKRDFCEALRRITIRYFWAKQEWEVLVCGWPRSEYNSSCKMDAYDQLKINSEHLCEYIWRWRKEIAKLCDSGIKV